MFLSKHFLIIFLLKLIRPDWISNGKMRPEKKRCMILRYKGTDHSIKNDYLMDAYSVYTKTTNICKAKDIRILFLFKNGYTIKVGGFFK